MVVEAAARQEAGKDLSPREAAMGIYAKGLHPRGRARSKKAAHSGSGFATNWAGWRPILAFCNQLIFEDSLPLSTDGWDYNDGRGLQSQHECDQLADALEGYLVHYYCGEEGDPFIEDPFSDNFVIWLDEDQETVVALPDDPEFQQLFKKRRKEVTWTSGEDVRDFIAFLRNCGGFEIH
jgi:hypothetical protein